MGVPHVMARNKHELEEVRVGTIIHANPNYKGGDPDGWMRAEGQALSVRDYPELAMIMPDEFMGNNGTFFLPDLRQEGHVGYWIKVRPNKR